jgi:hypothetical protein
MFTSVMPFARYGLNCDSGTNAAGGVAVFLSGLEEVENEEEEAEDGFSGAWDACIEGADSAEDTT